MAIHCKIVFFFSTGADCSLLVPDFIEKLRSAASFQSGLPRYNLLSKSGHLGSGASWPISVTDFRGKLGSPPQWWSPKV